MSKENSFCNNHQNFATCQLVLKEIILISTAHPVWHSTHNVCKVQNIEWFEFSQQIIHLFNERKTCMSLYFPKRKFKHHKNFHSMPCLHDTGYLFTSRRQHLDDVFPYAYILVIFLALFYREVIALVERQENFLAEHWIQYNIIQNSEYALC